MNFFRTILIFTALCTLPVWLGAQKDTVVTPRGYRFVNHTHLDSPHARPGQFVSISVNTWLRDTLIASTALFGGPREIAIPSLAPLPKQSPVVFDAVLLMAKGDSATLIQPIDSLFRKALPAVYKNETQLRYEIVLIDFYSVAEKEEREKAREAARQARLLDVEQKTRQLAQDFKKGKLKDQLKKTSSGLQYIVHEPGSGAMLQNGQPARVHYYVCLSNGKSVDESYSRGEPIDFIVGDMIPGFNEAMTLLRPGAKATLFVPYRLAYGEEGAPPTVPARADLIFYVEIQ